MPNPIINPAILLSPVENGYVAYDPIVDRVHHLNPFAALLAELCDGSRSVEDIRRLVTPLMSDGDTAEVKRWVDEGFKAGLLVWRGEEAESHRQLTADELAKLAKHLRATGRVQTAYLCGKKLVELTPEDWDAWYYLGGMAMNLGRRSEGREAYQKYFDHHPEDHEIEHLLVALRDDTPPPRAPDRTIQCIYKDFADHYESLMVTDLKYRGPQQMAETLKAVIGDRKDMSVLDLGCGSGLSGMTLKHFASRIVGIDLSPEMVDLAAKRNIYDRLEVAEITGWLNQTKDTFDLIAACDCLIYFGDLHEIVEGAVKRLNPRGIVVLTMERGPKYPFRLTDTGRFEHHPDHVRDVARDAGLTVARLDEAFLRTEYGNDVTGIYAVLTQ